MKKTDNFIALNKKKMHLITGGEDSNNNNENVAVSPCISVCDATIVSTCCVYLYIPPKKKK